MTMLYPEAEDRERMRLFWRDDGISAIANGERVALEQREAGWQITADLTAAEEAARVETVTAARLRVGAAGVTRA